MTRETPKSRCAEVPRGLDKLMRCLLVGGALVVTGVGLMAVSGSGLPFPPSESIGILGAVSVAIGITMAIGALWIDLSQLNGERDSMSVGNQ